VYNQNNLQRYITMKKLLLLFTLFVGVAMQTHAQKFAYVDTEYVLKQMPQYAVANNAIDSLANAWQDEIDSQQSAIDQMESTYNKNEYLMTEQQKVSKKTEIDAARRAVRENQSKRFGFKGDLFQKRQELVRPLQDKIYNAIKKMAEQRGYDFILDKSTGVSILYANAKFDMSEELLNVVKASN